MAKPGGKSTSSSTAKKSTKPSTLAIVANNSKPTLPVKKTPLSAEYIADSDDDSGSDHEVSEVTKKVPHPKTKAIAARRVEPTSSPKETHHESSSGTDGRSSTSSDDDREEPAKSRPSNLKTNGYIAITKALESSSSAEDSSDEDTSSSSDEEGESRNSKNSIQRGQAGGIKHNALAQSNGEDESETSEDSLEQSSNSSASEDDSGKNSEDPTTPTPSRKTGVSSDARTLQIEQSQKSPSHRVEFRPVPAFQPPSGYRPMSNLPTTSKTIDMFQPSKTKGKQIWYIQAPASVPITSIKEVALNKYVAGQAVISHEGDDYVFITDESAKATTRLLIPAKNGFDVLPGMVDDVVHLQKMVRLLTPAQSPTLLPSISTNLLPEKPVVKNTKREQPAGLRMRFTPSGSITKEPGEVELLDHGVQPHPQQNQSLLGKSAASKKRKVPWIDSPSGEKRKKKHTDSQIHEKVVIQGEPQTNSPSGQAAITTAKNSNGLGPVMAPATVTLRKGEGEGDESKIKHKEKDRKKKKEKKRNKEKA